VGTVERRWNMKSRFRYWVIFLALTLLSPCPSRGLKDPADQAIAILDRATEALESELRIEEPTYVAELTNWGI
jgi:hypothetical protein